MPKTSSKPSLDQRNDVLGFRKKKTKYLRGGGSAWEPKFVTKRPPKKMNIGFDEVRTRRSNHNDNANDNNSFKKQRLCLTRRRIKRRGKQFHRPRPLRCSHILKATTYLEDLSCFCSKARRLDRNYNSDDNGRQEGLGEKRALDNC